MNTVISSTGSLYLVVGYDGSAPSTRALDAAAGLLRGRDGSIEVVYVGHMTAAEMMSADAIVEVEAGFGEVAQELRARAAKQLEGQAEHWTFRQAQGMITDALIGEAEKIRVAHPGDYVAIVVGSSSQAMHRLVGSVAAGLARHAPVPLVIVP